MCAGVSKSGSPRISDTTVRPRACTWRISARIELTAVGFSTAERREDWMIARAGKCTAKVEKWKSGRSGKVSRWASTTSRFSATSPNARDITFPLFHFSTLVQLFGCFFSRSVFFRAVLTDFAKMRASSDASWRSGRVVTNARVPQVLEMIDALVGFFDTRYRASPEIRRASDLVGPLCNLIARSWRLAAAGRRFHQLPWSRVESERTSEPQARSCGYERSGLGAAARWWRVHGECRLHRSVELRGFREESNASK